MHPLAVRHLLLPVHERLFGRNTVSYAHALERSQWWSLDRLRDLQERKLRGLLENAAAYCPFYRRRLDAAGLDPARVTLDALTALAPITKDDIRAHADEMIDPRARRRLHPYSTGGSTGEPLLFKIDRARQAADQAARIRSRRWFGIEPGERELYLWGAPVELAAQDRLKRLRDRLTNHRLLGAFHMTQAMMSDYLRKIERFDPVHIFGYPSSLARLAQHARRVGAAVRTPSLKAVFTTGEVFLPADRERIEEAVRVPVADGYGSREAGFIAHQCPLGRYHVTMESLIVELLDLEGRPVDAVRSGGDPSPVGEVTVTHLDARGMPFIRYRTGDLARRPSTVCPCGRGLESLEIVEGRRTDMLRTADGGSAHALSVIYVLREEPDVRQFKVVQKPNCDLDVAVVAGPAFDAVRRRRVSASLRRCIGGDITVRLRTVNEIPPDPSGKHRHVTRETK
ncbi:MAG: phenylacetate--CoA ligase family protein [Phycisphaerae bacterium]